MSELENVAMSGAPKGAGRRVRLVAIAVVALAILGAIAWFRGGLLGLPPAPSGVDAERAGLADLGRLQERAARLERAAQQGADPDSTLATAGRGLAALREGDVEAGLEQLRAALWAAPGDLVIGNAFRMALFHLKRAALADASGRETLSERLPPALAGEPLATLERLAREHPGRETSLQLSLAWADELLLYGALEIKAPASVESVNLLNGVLAAEPAYVPALYGRGLNYLHRPARLVWPERIKAARDAASRDLGLCVAIGRRIGGAPPRLVATLALTLGDAYAKEGKHERARSWWQIAQNADRDSTLLEAVRRRFEWGDQEMLTELEEELESRMLDLDRPLTDLAVIWGGS